MGGYLSHDNATTVPHELEWMTRVLVSGVPDVETPKFSFQGRSQAQGVSILSLNDTADARCVRIGAPGHVLNVSLKSRHACTLGILERFVRSSLTFVLGEVSPRIPLLSSTRPISSWTVSPDQGQLP